jgi:hypothetical protein
LQEFARFQQVGRVLWASGASVELCLRRRGRLVDEQPAWPDGSHYLRKNLPLEVEERHHHLKSHFDSYLAPRLPSLEVSEIIYYKANAGRERPGILLCLFDSGLRDINEGHFPPLLRQPDCVASGSAREVEGGSSVRKQRQNEF